jgi:hypothetical protein
MIKYVYDKGQGAGKKEEIGEVLYNRGLAAAMVTVEAVRKAQVKYGKKPLKGSEVRWGLENLEIDAAAIKKLGFTGYMTPGEHQLRQPCRRSAGHDPQLGRQEVERAAGRVPRRQQHPQADDPQFRREVRGGEEAHEARLRQGSRLIFQL